MRQYTLRTAMGVLDHVHTCCCLRHVRLWQAQCMLPILQPMCACAMNHHHHHHLIQPAMPRNTHWFVCHALLCALQRDIISLESVAANEATFRVPDQDGWQPSNTPITDVPSPCCVLRPAQPPPAAISTSSSYHQQNGYTGAAAAAAAGSTPGEVPGTACAGQAAPPSLGAGNGVLPSMGNDLGTSACCQQLTTDLPLQHMQQVLANAGYQCQVSSDAGR